MGNSQKVLQPKMQPPDVIFSKILIIIIFFFQKIFSNKSTK